MLKGLMMIESVADRGLSVHPQTELLWVLHSPGLYLCPQEQLEPCCASLTRRHH